jgi:hypothetical protein
LVPSHFAPYILHGRILLCRFIAAHTKGISSSSSYKHGIK